MIGGLFNMGVGIAGLTGAFDPAKAAPRNIQGEVNDYLGLLPSLLGAANRYMPEYSSLYNRLQEQALFGTPGGSYNEAYYNSTPETGQAGAFGPQAGQAAAAPTPADRGFQVLPSVWGDQTRRFGQPAPAPYQVQQPSGNGLYKHVRTVNTPAAPGLLDLYERAAPRLADLQLSQYEAALPRLTALQGQAQRSLLANDTASYREFAPQILSAFRESFPSYAGGLDTLLGTGTSDLASGYQLSPAERRMLTQNVRGAQAARGMGYGGGDVAEEALAQTQAGQALRQQRLDNMRAILSLYGASIPQLAPPQMRTGPEALAAALSSGNGAGALLAGTGGSIGFGAGQFGTPFNSYSAGVYGGNQGMDQAYNNLIAAIRAQSASQTAKGAGQVVQGAFGIPSMGSNNSDKSYYSSLWS